MRRYIITGTPGAGKTTLVRELAARGYAVVPEAATDVVNRYLAAGRQRPWEHPRFVARIAALQRRRLRRAPGAGIQFHDRSPICTLALAWYLGVPVPASLAAEVARVVTERVYDRTVFVVRPLGFVTPTRVRRISYAESLEFERLHEEAYRRHGFELVDIPRADVTTRADLIERHLAGGRLEAGRWPGGKTLDGRRTLAGGGRCAGR